MIKRIINRLKIILVGIKNSLKLFFSDDAGGDDTGAFKPKTPVTTSSNPSIKVSGPPSIKVSGKTVRIKKYPLKTHLNIKEAVVVNDGKKEGKKEER